MFVVVSSLCCRQYAAFFEEVFNNLWFLLLFARDKIILQVLQRFLLNALTIFSKGLSGMFFILLIAGYYSLLDGRMPGLCARRAMSLTRNEAFLEMAIPVHPHP